MLQDSETTTEHRTPRPAARIGRDGLAQIGASRFDLAGLRFVVDPEPNEPTEPTEPAEPAEPADPNDPADPAEDPEDPAFEGEFDAKRARSLITKLRADLKAANAAKAAPKPEAQDPKLTGENLRLRIALRAGLDEDLADRLRGSTEEELLADAEKLVARLSPGEKKPLETRTPQAQLRGGTDPNKEPELTSVDVVKAALGR